MPYIITGPAIVKILAPTPSIKPSAAVNIGHSSLQNIYIKSAVWYNNLTKQDEIEDFCVSENIVSFPLRTANALRGYGIMK